VKPGLNCRKQKETAPREVRITPHKCRIRFSSVGEAMRTNTWNGERHQPHFNRRLPGRRDFLDLGLGPNTER